MILNYFCCIRLFHFHPEHNHDIPVSLPFIIALTTSVYVVKPVHLLCWYAEMTVNIHQIRSRLRAVYRENHWLSAHSPWFNWINLCLSGSTRCTIENAKRQQATERTNKKRRATGRVGEKSGDRAEEKDRKRQDERLMRQSGEIENWMI